MFINRLAVAAYGCNDNVNVDDDLQQSCGVWQPMVAGKVAAHRLKDTRACTMTKTKTGLTLTLSRGRGDSGITESPPHNGEGHAECVR